MPNIKIKVDADDDGQVDKAPLPHWHSGAKKEA